MEFQITIHDGSGKGVIVVQTPQQLWDAIAAATEPALDIIPRRVTIKVNRVITMTETR